MEQGYPAKVAAFMAANPPPPVEVWACHWRAVELFGALSGRWIYNMNGPVALDIAQARAVAKTLGIRLDARRFDQLRIMEAEARRHIRRHIRRD